MHRGGIVKVDAEAFVRVAEMLRSPLPPSPALIELMRRNRETLKRVNGVCA